MAATQEDIRKWIEDGERQGMSHMLVVCDTFDYEDFPVYVRPGEDPKEKSKQYDGPNMTRLMEVYNLSKDTDEQLAEGRARNF